MRPSRGSLRGFTLIELLLVMTLLPILSFAMYSNFNSGFRLWKAANRDIPEEAPAFFYQRAAADLQNMRRYAAMPFQGAESEIVFCAGVPSAPALGGKRGLGQVRYYFDGSQKAVFREEKNFSQVYKERPGRISRVLEHAESFRIDYLIENKAEKTVHWAGAWQSAEEGALPLAVRFHTDSAPFGERRSDSHTFAVPVGGGGE